MESKPAAKNVATYDFFLSLSDVLNRVFVGPEIFLGGEGVAIIYVEVREGFI